MGGARITQAEALKIIGIQVLDPEITKNALATMVGRHHETVRRVNERYKALLDEYRELKSGDIIDELDIVRRAHLANIADPVKLLASTALDSAKVYGILTEKLLLESGRPTSITLSAQVDATMPDVLGRLKRALEARGQATRSSDGQAIQEPKQ